MIIAGVRGGAVVTPELGEDFKRTCSGCYFQGMIVNVAGRVVICKVNDSLTQAQISIADSQGTNIGGNPLPVGTIGNCGIDPKNY